MTDSIPAVVEAFDPSSATLARRDRSTDVRSNTTGPETVPVEHATRSFAAYDDMVDSSGRVMVPLHEYDSTTLTGEYLLYSENGLVPAYAYYDTSRDGWARIDAEQLPGSELAWQLRFWTAAYESPTTPKTATDAELPAAPATVIPPNTTYTDRESQDFYDSLRTTLSDLEAAARQDRRAAYNELPFRGFRRQFGGIPVGVPLRYVETVDGPLCTILVPEDHIETDLVTEFDLYPDNEVLIDIDDVDSRMDSIRQRGDFPVEGIITEVGGNSIHVRLLSERNDTAAHQALEAVFANDGAILRILPLHNPVPYDRERAAIETVRTTQPKRGLVTGNDPLLFDPQQVDATFPNLNQSQTAAAKRALAADSAICLHGPPGTGKTRTLVALVKSFVDQGARVLACAHSNQATDNLLVGTSSPTRPDPDSLHAAAQNGTLTLARAGSGSTNEIVASTYESQPLSRADVVGATTSAAAVFDPDTFDVAVVDEASQASLQASLLPVTAAERIILAGDHMQLPPYEADELDTRENAVSLFEHLLNRYGDESSSLLRTQYRMHPTIAAFPNQEFYDGRLDTPTQLQNRTVDGLAPVAAYDVSGGEVSTGNHSWRNDTEAEIVATEVKQLVDYGTDPGEIGVVTPYRGQIGAVRQALDRVRTQTASVTVDTVDSFQGGEREAIVVSFVRSNETGTAGFLTHPTEGSRRLNVAMTRARKRLVLIGDWDTLCAREPTDASTGVYRRLRSWLADNGFFRTRSG